jgi:hypothetical protein
MAGPVCLHDVTRPLNFSEDVLPSLLEIIKNTGSIHTLQLNSFESEIDDVVAVRLAAVLKVCNLLDFRADAARTFTCMLCFRFA